MTCVSVRFTWYDDCGVAAITAIVPYKSFGVTIVEACENMPVKDFRKLSCGRIEIDEVQKIENSVCTDSFFVPIGRASNFDFYKTPDILQSEQNLQKGLISLIRDFSEDFLEVKDDASSVNESTTDRADNEA